MKVSCIVLAGGKSIRLGRNKIEEIIGERSLLERVISTLSKLNTEIIIVAAKDSILPQLTQYKNLTYVQDIIADRGSLGGIYSGLVATKSDHNLVVAGDMPFLNLDLLQFMIENSEDYDLVVPKLKGNIYEPLHAIYSKKCIVSLERLIEGNIFRIIDLFTMVKTKYIEEKEIDRFDAQHLSFFNINTEADLKAGREIVGKEGIHCDKC